MSTRRKSVDLLPPAADAIRAWAIEALQSGRVTQRDVWMRLNTELKRLGLREISHSAFCRWALDGTEFGFAAVRAPSAPVERCCPTCGNPLGVRRLS
jgi:hypothetical protein